MKQSVLVFLFFIFLNCSFGQEVTSKKFQAGFSLSPNYSFLQAKGSKPKELNLLPGPGIGLGILAEYHFNKKLALSSRAGLSFNNAFLDYKNSQGDLLTSTRAYNQTLDFALLGQVYLGNKKNRPYLVFGPSATTPLPKSDNDAAVIFNKTTLAVDFGFGFDVSLKNLHFAPEMRYSYGLTDMNSSPQLDQLYFHRLTLAFNFKG